MGRHPQVGIHVLTCPLASASLDFRHTKHSQVRPQDMNLVPFCESSTAEHCITTPPLPGLHSILFTGILLARIYFKNYCLKVSNIFFPSLFWLPSTLLSRHGRTSDDSVNSRFVHENNIEAHL